MIITSILHKCETASLGFVWKWRSFCGWVNFLGMIQFLVCFIVIKVEPKGLLTGCYPSIIVFMSRQSILYRSTLFLGSCLPIFIVLMISQFRFFLVIINSKDLDAIDWFKWLNPLIKLSWTRRSWVWVVTHNYRVLNCHRTSSITGTM